jgi:hypothetical protein
VGLVNDYVYSGMGYMKYRYLKIKRGFLDLVTVHQKCLKSKVLQVYSNAVDDATRPLKNVVLKL